jgi:hypothetical protein
VDARWEVWHLALEPDSRAALIEPLETAGLRDRPAPLHIAGHPSQGPSPADTFPVTRQLSKYLQIGRIR